MDTGERREFRTVPFIELYGTLFAVKVRELFLTKGISLTQGYRDRV